MDFLEEREDDKDEEVKRRGNKVLLPKKNPKDCHNEYIITCMHLGKSIYVFVDIVGITV